MKILQVLVLMLSFLVITNAQKQNETGILTGKIYDQIGETIQKAKVTLRSQNGKKYETFTNENGIYELELPFTIYKGNYDIRTSPITKYSIKVECRGFKVVEIRDFNFIQPKSRKMQFDMALEVGLIQD